MVVVKRPAAPPESDDFGPQRKAAPRSANLLKARQLKSPPPDNKRPYVFCTPSSKYNTAVAVGPMKWPKKRLGLDGTGGGGD